MLNNFFINVVLNNLLIFLGKFLYLDLIGNSSRELVESQA